MSWIEHGPTMTTSRGSRPSSTLAIATRVSETTFEARSLIGISSSRIAGGMSGRTCVMRRSSVRRNISPKITAPRRTCDGTALADIRATALVPPSAGRQIPSLRTEGSKDALRLALVRTSDG